MNEQETLTETEVRQLRDQVYGATGDKDRDDRNWHNCREHWLQAGAVQWLIAHASWRK